MTDERIIAYLLEELPEEEAAQFEEDCFAQRRWPREIKRVEEDLIDNYLRDELPLKQRKHFEQNYLTNEARVKRVQRAAALLRVVDETPVSEPVVEKPDGPSWFRHLIDFWNNQTWGLPAFAALGLFLVLGGAWWFSRPRMPTQPTVAMLTLTISADARRGSGDIPPNVRLSPDVDALSINLKLPGEADGPPSRVELLKDDGEVSPLTIEARDAGTVNVMIPAAQLKRGLYALRVFTKNAEGAEQRLSGSYFFIVE